MRHEQVAFRDLEERLPDVMNDVAYRKRRVFLTYRGVPMAQIVPISDAAILDERDEKIYAKMTKRAAKHKFYVDDVLIPYEEISARVDAELKKNPPKKPSKKEQMSPDWAPFAKELVRYLRRRQRNGKKS